MSPWVDFHRANQESEGELERFVFNRVARFPEAPPAGGEKAVWTEAHAGPSTETVDPRYPTVFVPVRDAAGQLLAGVAIEVDARRYVADAMETWQAPGDFWFATDSDGHVVCMTPRAAAVLGWSGSSGAPLTSAPAPALKDLAARGRSATRSSEEYLIDGKRVRVASARIALDRLGLLRGPVARGARHDPRRGGAGVLARLAVDAAPRRPAALRASPAGGPRRHRHRVAARLGSRRRSSSRAAEEIGRGRTVQVGGGDQSDELGRLAAAIDTMGRRVARRVETLRRLHQFSRSAYRMTDVKEVLARSAQAIAAFTNAERVWFYLYDRNTHRLEAAVPAFNLTEEVASRLKVSVDARSIEGMVFRTGEPYSSQRRGSGPVRQPRAPAASSGPPTASSRR